MRRFSSLPAFVGSVTLAIGAGAGCGNLIIPSNDAGSDNGSSSSSSSSSGTSNGSGSANASGDGGLAPPDCDAGYFPVALACTDLYSDWSSLTLSPDVQSYSLDPAFQEWVDGAQEKEWVFLPQGAKITTTDLNNWVFPEGTKFWQELSVLGARIETRFAYKLSTGQWFRTTYVWNVDQTAAPELNAGSANAFGLPYDIPSVSQCDQCHQGSGDYPLGFELVSLAQPRTMGVNLQTLEQQGVLTNNPAVVPSLPGPVGYADDAGVTAGSLAYLHSNCGTSCHNRNVDANAGATGLFLKLTVDGTGAIPPLTQTDLWQTSYDVPSSYTPSGYDAGSFWRIHPGDPAHSTIPWRSSRRNTPAQMPPIATELPDQSAVLKLDTWTNELPAGQASGDAGAPAPTPDAAAPVDASTLDATTD